MGDEQAAEEAEEGEDGGSHGAAGRLLVREESPMVYILPGPEGLPIEEEPRISSLFHRTPRGFPE